MKKFSELRKNLKNKFSNLKSIKVAVLADSSSQFLTQALRGIGYDRGFDLQIWEAEFNQIEQQIIDINSELYKYKPEIIIIFKSSQKLLEKYNKLSDSECANLASNELELINNMNSTISTQISSKLIYYNYMEIDDAIYGNYSWKVKTSFLFQLRKLNYHLMDFSSNNLNFYLCDISSLQNQLGKHFLFNTAIYVNNEMILSIESLPHFASKTLDLIGALNGEFKKCLIIDLDNTIWGGAIGDIGIENIQIGDLGIGKAFSEFQFWIKKLKNRGIILAVCSKNTEKIAKEPFEKHPDMILQLKDFSVFIANWENKVNNIIQIQNVLNIGFDSMVFLDDNPFERNIVRENLSEITVPELPEDPSEYLEYLYGLNLFETVSYSNEDKDRTEIYQNERQRNINKITSDDENDFLKKLDMVASVEQLNKFNIPRVAQLSQRSNQFNLRTIRYTEMDIKNISESEDYVTFVFRLKDRFGDNGLICVVILLKESKETLFIDTWFMSCRVLNRGMENFVLNTLVNFAKENDYSILKAEYIETPKNKIVKDLYKKLDFKENGYFWELNQMGFQNKLSYVNEKNK